MSEFNSKHNRAVWFDIPVANLDRAVEFYAGVLGIQVHKERYGEVSFAVLEHHEGNGGCLIPEESAIRSDGGILIYLNVEGRIRDAVAQVERLGGNVVHPIHAIGPHGFKSVVLDSEGNRIALHSMVDR